MLECTVRSFFFWRGCGGYYLPSRRLPSVRELFDDDAAAERCVLS